jgi:hypothetical protein
MTIMLRECPELNYFSNQFIEVISLLINPPGRPAPFTLPTSLGGLIEEIQSIFDLHLEAL